MAFEPRGSAAIAFKDEETKIIRSEPRASPLTHPNDRDFQNMRSVNYRVRLRLRPSGIHPSVAHYVRISEAQTPTTSFQRGILIVWIMKRCQTSRTCVPQQDVGTQQLFRRLLDEFPLDTHFGELRLS